MANQGSKSILSSMRLEIFTVWLIATNIDITKPINLPNSSTNPLVKPSVPLSSIYKKASPSRNQLIYSNSSLTNLLAIPPSTFPLLCCITADITFPISERLFAEV